MSHYQTKGDQSRKGGRVSGGGSHQKVAFVSINKGGGAGGPGPSASAPPESVVHQPQRPSSEARNRQDTHKRANGPPVSSRGSSSTEFSAASQVPNAQSLPGHTPKQRSTPVTNTSDVPARPSATIGISSVSDGLLSATPAVQFQFGSISPNFMCPPVPLQIPPRTTSAPPNLDEQKREQAQFEAARLITSRKQPADVDVHENHGFALPRSTSVAQPPISHSSLAPPTKVSAPLIQGHMQPYNQPPIQSTGLMQQQPIPPQSFPQQNQGVNYGPPMLPPHLAHLGNPMAQMSHSMGPQIGTAMGPQMPLGVPSSHYGGAPANQQYFQPRESKAIKIVHPDTHQEITVPSSSSSSRGFNNGQSQVRPAVGYSSGNPYPAVQNGPYGGILYASQGGIPGGPPSNAPTGRYSHVLPAVPPVKPVANSGHKVTTSSTLSVNEKPKNEQSRSVAASIKDSHKMVKENFKVSKEQSQLHAENDQKVAKEKSNDYLSKASNFGTSRRSSQETVDAGKSSGQDGIMAENIDRRKPSHVITDIVGQEARSAGISVQSPEGSNVLDSMPELQCINQQPEQREQREAPASVQSNGKQEAPQQLHGKVSDRISKEEKLETKHLPVVSIAFEGAKQEREDVSASSTLVASAKEMKWQQRHVAPKQAVQPVNMRVEGARELENKCQLDLDADNVGNTKLKADDVSLDVLESVRDMETNGQLTLDSDSVANNKLKADVLDALESAAKGQQEVPMQELSVPGPHINGHDDLSHGLNLEDNERSEQSKEANSLTMKPNNESALLAVSGSEGEKAAVEYDPAFNDRVEHNQEKVASLAEGTKGVQDDILDDSVKMVKESVASAGDLKATLDDNQDKVGPVENFEEVQNLQQLSSPESLDAVENSEEVHHLQQLSSPESLHAAASQKPAAGSSSTESLEDLSNSFLENLDLDAVKTSAFENATVTKQVEESPKNIQAAIEVKAGNKKKNRKQTLAKADALGTTADLYNAYKAPEVKKNEEVKMVEHPIVDVALDVKKPASPSPKKASVPEIDNWEDAAELPTPKPAGSDSTETQSKRYTRDFLLTFRDQCKGLPQDFGGMVPDDIIDGLFYLQAGVNTLWNETLGSPGRMLERSSSRRGMGGAGSEEDRWTKPGGFPQSPGHGFVEGGRVYRGQFPPSPIVTGARPMMPPLVGMPLMPTPTGTRGIDADRWQRAPQKGIFPSPQTPLPAIHKAEKRYEIRQVSDEEEKKQRQIKAILNKLTPQNFDKLFEQVKAVNVETATTLNGVISQIFDKALMEPTFCEMYAKFCVQLSVELPEFSEDGEKVTFKRVLLNKCQEEFERGVREQQEAEKLEEDGQIKLSKEEREEKRLKARRRMLGNIRFIGELYKKNMLTERIMHECICSLLGVNEHRAVATEEPDEEDVEALCKLMATIGRMIDHAKAKSHMDSYFKTMETYSVKEKLPSRLRFMLKDIIDLRRNHWQERRKVEGPKKIDEVRRDAVQERSRDRDRSLSRGMSMGGGSRRGGPADFSSRGPISPFPSSVNRGPQPPIRTAQDVRFEDNRYVPMALPRSSDNVALAPQGTLGKSSVRGQPAIGNPYIGVPMASDRGLHGFREESQMNTDFRSFEYSHPERAGQPYRPGTPPMQASRTSSQPVHHILSHRPVTPTGLSSSRPNSAPTSLPEEQLEKKSTATIEEYYSVRSMEEVAMCIGELNAPRFHSKMLSMWLKDSLEKKDNNRHLLADLIIYLQQQVILSQDQVIQGFRMLLSTFEDTAVDVPKAPEYVATIIAKAVNGGVFTLNQVWKILEDSVVDDDCWLESRNALEILGGVLDNIRGEKGEHAMLDLYKSSDLHINSFISSNSSRKSDFDAMLEKKKLQCLYPLRVR